MPTMAVRVAPYAAGPQPLTREPKMIRVPNEAITRLENIVGHGHLLKESDVFSRWPGYGAGNLDAGLLIRPSSTEQVADCVCVCSDFAIPIVVHGGLTGLVRGCKSAPGQLILSTERLNQIHGIDVARRLIDVGAGVKLQSVQTAAAGAGLHVGIDIGSRGSCTIGGNVATNAGGSRVVRYGMTRSQIAGLEVVLADGAVISETTGLIKNNTGFDLKQLFIGTEGICGIVTRVLVRLDAAPTTSCAALLAFDRYDDALKFYEKARAELNNRISAVEVMWREYYSAVCQDMLAGKPPPLAAEWPIFVLFELESVDKSVHADAAMQDFLGDIEYISSGVIAKSGAEAARFWEIRDGSDSIERLYPAVYSFDVSLSPSDFTNYIEKVKAGLASCGETCSLYSFGHMADGNIHFMVGCANADPSLHGLISNLVYDPLSRYVSSSISAEHCIGIEKAAHVSRSRPAQQLALMRLLKRSLDPKGLLNPHIAF